MFVGYWIKCDSGLVCCVLIRVEVQQFEAKSAEDERQRNIRAREQREREEAEEAIRLALFLVAMCYM